MKIVCCSNMPFVREAFSTLGEVVVLDGRSIAHEHVRNADILAIRSITKANRALLEGSSVKFVGTATIGTDHLDIGYLDGAGIEWCYAPGCNANSVAEYIVAALLCLAERHGFLLRGRTIGVVGVGNVGSLVAKKAQALGMRVLMNDPPRQRSEPDGPAVFVALDKLLAESDIVTLHVPLTDAGPDATRHMADAGFFARMKRGAIFVNAARGPVVHTGALLEALGSGAVAQAVIDTWEGEPCYRQDLLDAAALGTPHIAGHSFEGKVAGTVAVYREACRFLGVKPCWSPESLMQAPPEPELEFDAGFPARAGAPAAGSTSEAREQRALRQIVRRLYDVEADDAQLRACPDPRDDAARAKHFDSLRKHYRERREFGAVLLKLKNESASLKQTLVRLGCRVAAS